MDRRSALLALVGAFPFARAALAQPAPVPGPLDPIQYRQMVLMGGEFAIATSRIALERGMHPAVQEFAQLEINEQMGVAASLGGGPGTVPLRPDQAALVQRLSAMAPGPRFDAMYVQGQIVGHNELLAINEGYLRSGGGETVSTAVANVSVPTIQTHLAVLGRLRRGGMQG